MKQNLNDMEIAVKLAVVAITAIINYGSLIGIYRLIMRDIRLEREDIPKVASVYIVAPLIKWRFYPISRCSDPS